MYSVALTKSHPTCYIKRHNINKTCNGLFMKEMRVFLIKQT